MQWLTGIQEFDLTSQEAREIASAYADVAKHYPAVAIDPKHQAVVNLISAVSIPVGARIVMYKMRKAQERRERAAQAGQTPRPASMTPPPSNNPQGEPPDTRPPVTKELRTGEIPGVGTIEFPPEHPLMGGKRHH